MCCICVLDSIFCRKIFNTLSRASNFNPLYIIKICIITFLLQNSFSQNKFSVNHHFSLHKIFLLDKNQFVAMLSNLRKNLSSYLKEI